MHQQKDLNKALNIGLISLVGALIPVIGLILALTAALFALTAPREKHTFSRRATIVFLATASILLSLGTGYVYYRYYSDQQKQAATHARAEASERERQKLDADFRRFQLESCLTTADRAYNDYLKNNATNTSVGSSGEILYYMPQEQWNYVENKRTSEKDECFRLYPSQ